MTTYANITGISRVVAKDNAQETLADYNGNARPGELVVNLDVDPPALYISNNSGALTNIASTVNPVFDSLTVGEEYSATPLIAYVNMEGDSADRLMRMGSNMSTYAQSSGPAIEITAYRESPAEGDTGPILVFRQSTLASPDLVVSGIYSNVSNVAVGNVNSTLTMQVRHNDSYADVLTVSGSNVILAADLVAASASPAPSINGFSTINASDIIKTSPKTTGSIWPAASAGAGARAFVTDATSVTFNAAYVGGGANAMPVFSNGTAWFIG